MPSPAVSVSLPVSLSFFLSAYDPFGRDYRYTAPRPSLAFSALRYAALRVSIRFGEGR